MRGHFETGRGHRYMLASSFGMRWQNSAVVGLDDDDIGRHVDEIVRQDTQLLGVAVTPADIDDQVATFDPPRDSHLLSKGGKQRPAG